MKQSTNILSNPRRINVDAYFVLSLGAKHLITLKIKDQKTFLEKLHVRQYYITRKAWVLFVGKGTGSATRGFFVRLLSFGGGKSI